MQGELEHFCSLKALLSNSQARLLPILQQDLISQCVAKGEIAP